MPALLLLLLAAAAPTIPDSLPAEAVPNYRVIESGLAAAGQPALDTVARLKALGFKTVINLRPTGESPDVEKEKAAVEKQGLRYIQVPITPDTFSRADVDTVKKVLEDADAGPVLLHCASANRVGAVWAVIAHDRGRSLDEAEAEGKRAGLHSESMIAAFRKVAAPPAPTSTPAP